MNVRKEGWLGGEAEWVTAQESSWRRKIERRRKTRRRRKRESGNPIKTQQQQQASTTNRRSLSIFRPPSFCCCASSSPLARISFRRCVLFAACSLAIACKLDEVKSQRIYERTKKNNGGRRRTLHNNVIINEFPLWERAKKTKMEHLPEILRMARSIGSSRNMLSGWCCDHSFSSSVSSRSISEFFGVSSLICLLSSSFTLFILLLDNIFSFSARKLWLDSVLHFSLAHAYFLLGVTSRGLL